MKALKHIFTLILFFAISATSYADTLVERGTDYNKYQTGPNTYRLEVGGDNENALPFDGGGYQPWDLVYANGTPVGNWTWIGKGTQGYLIKPSLSIVRVYPVRGDQTKYIEIAPINVQPSIVNQIDNKNLEIYVDQTYSRWSLKMTPQGFKPEIVLKEGWTGTPQWQFRFELNGGLTLSGAKIMDGDTAVLKLSNPFAVDANGTVVPVQESLENGIATLTADLSGLTLPVTVDPTLGPVTADQDTWISDGAPTTGYGAYNYFILGPGSPIRRVLFLKDISAIPSGSIISNATITIESYSSSGAWQLETEFRRLTIADWEEAGTGTANAEANWNNYKDPNIAWPGGAGGNGDTDATVVDTNPATVWTDSNPHVFNITNNVQDAVTYRSGILSMLWKYSTETSSSYVYMIGRIFADPARRPMIAITYTVPTSTGNTHLGYKQIVF